MIAPLPIIRLVEERTSEQTRDRNATALVVFVGGTLDGVRREEVDPPDLIGAAGDTYRRSVRCADDGALRYVLDPGAEASSAPDAE